MRQFQRQPPSIKLSINSNSLLLTYPRPTLPHRILVVNIVEALLSCKVYMSETKKAIKPSKTQVATASCHVGGSSLLTILGLSKITECSGGGDCVASVNKWQIV